MGFRIEGTADPKRLLKLSFSSSEENFDARNADTRRRARDIGRNTAISSLAASLQIAPALPGKSQSAVQGRKIDLPSFEALEYDASLTVPRLSLRAFDVAPGAVPREGSSLREAAQQTPATDWARPGRSILLTLAVGTTAGVVAFGVYFFAWPTPRIGPPSPSTIAAPSLSAATVDPAPTTLPIPISALSQPTTPDPPALTPQKEAPDLVVAAVEPRAPDSAVKQPDPRPLNQEDILEAQVLLTSLGFDPGPLDGIVGPLTLAATDRYEAANGRLQTGTLDRAILERLRQELRKPIPPAQPVPRRAP